MTIPPWLIHLSIGILMALAGLLGIALTAITLPGIWTMILIAAAIQWFEYARTGTLVFSGWTFGVTLTLAVIAELVELVASAFGAAKAGATRWGALGSILGGLLGAVLGTLLIPVPLVGTLLGAAAGAGIGAVLAETHRGEVTWKQATTIGAGAAAGRLLASFVKVAFALIVAAILTVAAFV